MKLHKLHTIPTGGTIMGQVEVMIMVEVLQPLVNEEYVDDRNIYR